MGFSLSLVLEGMVVLLDRGHGGACQQLSGLLFVLLDGEIPLRREKTCPLWGMESRRRWSGPLPPAALARADSPLSR